MPYEELAESTELELVDLAAILLRVCRSRVDALLHGLEDDAAFVALGEARDQARDFFRASQLDVFEKDRLQELIALLKCLEADIERKTMTPSFALPLAARAVAEALDDVHGHQFALQFRDREPRPLGDGDPVPVLQPPLKALLRAPLVSRRESCGPMLEELRRLRLLPPLMGGYSVVVDASHNDVLADLEPESRLAVIVTGSVDDLEWDCVEGQLPSFFGVRPRDPEAKRALTLGLLEKAEEAGARIVVLPELCLDGESVDAVEQWYRERRRSCSVLVCGSVHVDGKDGRRNVCSTFLAGGGRVEHWKYNPVEMRLKADSSTVYREGIRATPRRITLHLSGDWSFTTLICKDLLEPETVRVLTALQVRMVLVPALSRKTGLFRDKAVALCGDAQAIVLVANQWGTADADPEPAAAILARPLEARPCELRSFPEKGSGLEVFTLAGD